MLVVFQSFSNLKYTVAGHLAVAIIINAGLDIGACPLAQANVENCQGSTNQGSLTRFGEYNFRIQNILYSK